MKDFHPWSLAVSIAVDQNLGAAKPPIKSYRILRSVGTGGAAVGHEYSTLPMDPRRALRD